MAVVVADVVAVWDLLEVFVADLNRRGKHIGRVQVVSRFASGTTFVSTKFGEQLHRTDTLQE